MRFREIDRLLRKDGWRQIDSTGSHRQYKHPYKAGKVTVPYHSSREFPKWLVASILKQAGISKNN